MELNLQNKVVGVTGAGTTNGIGFAIAKTMLREGAHVFISDINEPALDAVLCELMPYGDVRAYPADVSSDTDVKRLFESAMKDFGAIDVFVSNAGIYPQGFICDLSIDQWNRVMDVNLKSVFLCAKEAFSVMKESGGVLIHAVSYAALIGSAGSGAYAASKAAVYSLTKTLAAELAPYHIRVNGFIPGVIHTGMTNHIVDERGDSLLSQIALRRLGTPQDVANAVAFLASDAASYLTGTFIEISGGKLCVQNPDYVYQVLNR